MSALGDRCHENLLGGYVACRCLSGCPATVGLLRLRSERSSRSRDLCRLSSRRLRPVEGPRALYAGTSARTTSVSCAAALRVTSWFDQLDPVRVSARSNVRYGVRYGARQTAAMRRASTWVRAGR